MGNGEEEKGAQFCVDKDKDKTKTKTKTKTKSESVQWRSEVGVEAQFRPHTS